MIYRAMDSEELKNKVKRLRDLLHNSTKLLTNRPLCTYAIYSNLGQIPRNVLSSRDSTVTIASNDVTE